MVRKIFVGLFLVSLVFAMASCGGKVKVQETSGYSCYNLHYVSEKGVTKGSYLNLTNWPGHGFVPYNTKVRVIPMSKGKMFELTTDKGFSIRWAYDPSLMGMSADNYVKLIISPTPVSYEGLSDIDRQGIEAGKALTGMSKQGVKIALGYPAKHMTPSLESNKWVYWTSAHDPIAVNFDQSGKVVSSGKVGK